MPLSGIVSTAPSWNTDYEVMLTVLTDVEVVGPAVYNNVNYGELLQGSRKTFLLDTVMNKDAVLFAFILFPRNTNPIHLQLWRYDVLSLYANTYKLVYDYEYVPKLEDLNQRFAVGPKLKVTV